MLASPAKVVTVAEIPKPVGPPGRHMVFIATHQVGIADAQLFSDYALKLGEAADVGLLHSWAPGVPLWVMHFTQEGFAPDGKPWKDIKEEGESFVNHFGMGQVGFFSWTEKELFNQFPKMRESMGHVRAEPLHFRRYYWFHAALMLWRIAHSSEYNHIEYWWRIEDDVVFSGVFPGLLIKHASDKSDLLLSSYTSHEADPSWAHWRYNADEVTGSALPLSEQLYSTVAIGRFTPRFIRLMEARWQAGTVAFEELALPFVCKTSPGCTLGAFNPEWQGCGSKCKISADWGKVRTTPDWSCHEFISAYKKETREIWHPVKERNCFVTHLMNTRGESNLKKPRATNASKAQVFSHPLCGQLDNMIDLRTLTPPEWCNNDERSTNAAACQAAYVTMDTGVLPCEHDAGKNKCRSPVKSVDPIPC